MAQVARERFARRNEEEELRKAFDRLDSTGDGKIDAEELFSLFKWLNHKTSKVRELFFKTCPTFPKTFPSSKLKMSYGKWTTMVINA
mmetsp:Transcript_14370/g.62392  ORF Transcript_14370/g.62392 Transcript_14370/m.62392 type:complete len:87 (+) Transcript_14370:162-422(+)